MIYLTTELPDPLEHAGVLKTLAVTTSLPLLARDLNYDFILHAFRPKLR